MNIIFLAHFKQVDFLFFTHQPQLSLWSLEAALKQNGLTFLICNPFVFGEFHYRNFLRYSCQHSLFSNLKNNETLFYKQLNWMFYYLDYKKNIFFLFYII